MNTVIILSGVAAGIANLYDQLVRSLDTRFHDTTTHFPEWPVTDAEYAELETYAAYAGNFDASDGPPAGVPLERWIG